MKTKAERRTCVGMCTRCHDLVMTDPYALQTFAPYQEMRDPYMRTDLPAEYEIASVVVASSR